MKNTPTTSHKSSGPIVGKRLTLSLTATVFGLSWTQGGGTLWQALWQVRPFHHVQYNLASCPSLHVWLPPPSRPQRACCCSHLDDVEQGFLVKSTGSSKEIFAGMSGSAPFFFFPFCTLKRVSLPQNAAVFWEQTQRPIVYTAN